MKTTNADRLMAAKLLEDEAARLEKSQERLPESLRDDSPASLRSVAADLRAYDGSAIRRELVACFEREIDRLVP